jgi:hypothetical protein
VFTAVLVLTRFPEEDANVASFVFAPVSLPFFRTPPKVVTLT